MTPNDQNKINEPVSSDSASPADVNRPTREEAEAAVRTLIEWTGDNPDREGLLDTPARVIRSYDEEQEALSVKMDVPESFVMKVARILIGSKS